MARWKDIATLYESMYKTEDLSQIYCDRGRQLVSIIIPKED